MLTCQENWLTIEYTLTVIIVSWNFTIEKWTTQSKLCSNDCDSCARFYSFVQSNEYNWLKLRLTRTEIGTRHLRICVRMQFTVDCMIFHFIAKENSFALLRKNRILCGWIKTVIICAQYESFTCDNWHVIAVHSNTMHRSFRSKYKPYNNVINNLSEDIVLLVSHGVMPTTYNELQD